MPSAYFWFQHGKQNHLHVTSNIHDLMENSPNPDLVLIEGVEDDMMLHTLGPVARAQDIATTALIRILGDAQNTALQETQINICLLDTLLLMSVEPDLNEVVFGSNVVDELNHRLVAVRFSYEPSG